MDGLDSYKTSISNSNSNDSNCIRCKLRKGEIKCESCNYVYCLYCDKYTHSFPSKKLHKRYKINEIMVNDNENNNSQQDNNEIDNTLNTNKIENQRGNINNNSINISNYSNINNPNTSNSLYQNPQNDNINNTSNMNMNGNIQNQNQNEINYNLLYEKDLIEENRKLKEKYSLLHLQLSEINDKNKANITLMLDRNRQELNKHYLEREQQINYIHNSNIELVKKRDELMDKSKELENLIIKNQYVYDNKIKEYEIHIMNCKKDINRIRDYYENKIKFFTKNFTDEKNNIIESFEKKIDDLNSEYVQSKNNNLEIIKEKDRIIKDWENKFRTDQDLFVKEVQNLQGEYDVLHNTNVQLNKEKEENENNITNLNNDINDKEQIIHNFKEEQNAQIITARQYVDQRKDIEENIDRAKRIGGIIMSKPKIKKK